MNDFEKEQFNLEFNSQVPVPAKILPAANQASHKIEGLPRRLRI